MYVHVFNATSVFPPFLVSGCANPPVIANGRTNAKFAAVGHAISYSCNSCYEMEKFVTVKCLPNNTWSRPLPQCKRTLLLYVYIRCIRIWYSVYMYVCMCACMYEVLKG